MRNEQSWSLLDPRPVLLYLPKHDEYIVYWNGVALTHSQALCHAMERCGIYPTPEMKTAMQQTFVRLYYSGAFLTREWDQIINQYENIYDYQKRCIKDHLNKLFENKSEDRVKEVLGWFTYEKARIESINPPLEVYGRKDSP